MPDIPSYSNVFKNNVLQHIQKESRKQRTRRNLLFIRPFIYLCRHNNRAQEAGTLILNHTLI